MSTIKIILQILGLAYKLFGASEDELEAFMKLVDASSNNGRITDETRTVLMSQREKILARQKAKKDGTNV